MMCKKAEHDYSCNGQDVRKQKEKSRVQVIEPHKIVGKTTDKTVIGKYNHGRC